MSALLLEVTTRQQRGKQVQKLRRQGHIPAVVYGHDRPSQSLDVDGRAFERLWEKAGESSLIDLVIDGQDAVKAIIHDLQRDPTTNRILHVDFHQVNLMEKVTVDVALHFVGEAAAVKELGGTLIKSHDTIQVECLPKDLVREITVDVSSLKTFDDAFYMRDLRLPKGLELKEEPDDLLVHVEPPRTAEELAELETAVVEDVTQVEKTEKPKAEEEEAAAQPAEKPSEGETKHESR